MFSQEPTIISRKYRKNMNMHCHARFSKGGGNSRLPCGIM